MALNTVRLYRIRRLVDSIFHYSNNAVFTAGIRACFHAAFVGITHYANPERMPAMHASVCLWTFLACIRVKLELVLRTSGV
jgi:hypothetical protein